MKEIKAYIRREKAEEVLRALEGAGAPGLTVIEVKAMGEGPVDEKISVEYADWYRAVVKLELVCDGEDEDRFVNIIKKTAYTGERGDGMIFVSNIGYAVKIRTGKKCRSGLLTRKEG